VRRVASTTVVACIAIGAGCFFKPAPPPGAIGDDGSTRDGAIPEDAKVADGDNAIDCEAPVTIDPFLGGMCGVGTFGGAGYANASNGTLSVQSAGGKAWCFWSHALGGGVEVVVTPMDIFGFSGLEIETANHTVAVLSAGSGTQVYFQPTLDGHAVGVTTPFFELGLKVWLHFGVDGTKLKVGYNTDGSTSWNPLAAADVGGDDLAGAVELHLRADQSTARSQFNQFQACVP